VIELGFLIHPIADVVDPAALQAPRGEVFLDLRRNSERGCVNVNANALAASGLLGFGAAGASPRGGRLAVSEKGFRPVISHSRPPVRNRISPNRPCWPSCCPAPSGQRPTHRRPCAQRVAACRIPSRAAAAWTGVAGGRVR